MSPSQYILWLKFITYFKNCKNRLFFKSMLEILLKTGQAILLSSDKPKRKSYPNQANQPGSNSKTKREIAQIPQINTIKGAKVLKAARQCNKQ